MKKGIHKIGGVDTSQIFKNNFRLYRGYSELYLTYNNIRFRIDGKKCRLDGVFKTDINLHKDYEDVGITTVPQLDAYLSEFIVPLEDFGCQDCELVED